VYALLTLALTGSAAKAGLVGFARIAPLGALSLVGGVAADRFDRKRIMVAADTVRGMAVGLLAVSLATGRPPFAAILAVALVEGAGTAFFGPASAGAVRSVVPVRQLPAATSTSQARLATVRLIGPPLGGALYGIGRAVPFVADALSYACSLVTVLLMRTPFQEAREPSRERLRAQLRDGLRFLWAQRFLRTVALLLAVTNIVAPGISLAVVVVGREQGLSAGEIGAVVAALGVAMLAGSLASPLLRRWLKPRRILLLELWTWVGTGVFVLWPDVYVLAAAIIPCGFAIPNSDAMIGAYVLVVAPDRLVGRVDSAMITIAVATAPVGTLGAGVMLDAAGAQATVGALAGLALLVAVIGTLSPSMRTAPDLERLDAVTAPR
jgi:predicted MFS family arabinose efflux permease